MFTTEAWFPQLSVCVRLGQHPLSTSGCQLSGVTPELLPQATGSSVWTQVVQSGDVR